MKLTRMILCGAMCAVIASPASALRLINLDSVEHRLQLEASGSVTPITLAPGEMQNFPTTTSGYLRLLSVPASNNSAPIQAQGVLRGFIGNGRNQYIPVDEENEYAIWPGGDLVFQQRIRRSQSR